MNHPTCNRTEQCTSTTGLSKISSVVVASLISVAILMGVALTNGVSSKPAPIPVHANDFMMPARGQHLMVDLAGSTFDALNDEMKMKQATIKIIEETGMTLLGISSFKLEPQGVSVVATLAESHLTIHTWPEHGKALIDLFTCGAGFNLQKALPIVVREYQGSIEQSTYSVIPRGDYYVTKKNEHEKIHDQFQPLEIMSTHKYKQKVFETQSPHRQIAIWDHHDTLDHEYTPGTTTSLFLDGDMKSSVQDEKKYHESLVHPAFVASAVAPKRVLIVGGGEGAILRETLKWTSVEQVTMVDLDADVIQASRKCLPSYNNCTGFGSEVCFDDDRVELYTEDFTKWFSTHVGNDICDNQDDEKDKLFDMVVLDLLDASGSVPSGWGEQVNSELFFQRIACSLSESGVMVMSVGESPENSFTGETEDLERSTKKIEQIQSMSAFFRHTRVYETHISTLKSDRAFAIGMVPDFTGTTKDHENSGVNDYEGSPARVNLKLRRGLHPEVNLAHFDGDVQQSYQRPSSSWYDAYCLNPDNRHICEVPQLVFESELNLAGNAISGVVTSSIRLAASDVEALKTFGDKQSEKYSNFFKFVDVDVGEGGSSSSSRDRMHNTSLPEHQDSNPSGASDESLPWVQKVFAVWNPVALRIMSQQDHLFIFTGEIQESKLATDDCDTSFEINNGSLS